MKLFLFCSLFLLVVSPVLLFPVGEDESGGVKTANPQNLDDDDDREDIDQTAISPDDESTMEPNSVHDDDRAIRRHKKWKKWNKNRFNKLRRQDVKWSKIGRSYRERKGQWKKSPIQYEPRSPSVDQLNTVMDEMLLHLSKTMKEDSFGDLRLAFVPSDLPVRSWAYVAEKSDGEIAVEPNLRRKKEISDADVQQTDEVDEDAVDDNRDELVEDSQKPTPVDPEESKQEEDDDDEDDDVQNKSPRNEMEDRFYLTEKPSPVTQADGSVKYNLRLVENQDEIKRWKIRNGDKKTFRKHQRHEARQERKQELEVNKELNKEEGDEYNNKRKQWRDGNKYESGVKYRHRKQHWHKHGRFHYPRQPNARVEGLELIQRTGDVVIGKRENCTSRIFDVQLQIGPIRFIVNEKWTDLPVAKSSVTSPTLFARLRLTEKDGHLSWVRFKPAKIRSNDTVVSVQLDSKEDGQALDELQLATTVTHLSQEMARAWNSGYVLKRVKRQFKHLYVPKVKKGRTNGNQEAQRLTQSLFDPFSENPSTLTPIIN